MQPITNDSIEAIEGELGHWQELLSAAQADAANKTDQTQDAYLGELCEKVDSAQDLLTRAQSGDADATKELRHQITEIRTLFKRMERVTTPGGPPLA
jgi:hypothetical protein